LDQGLSALALIGKTKDKLTAIRDKFSSGENVSRNMKKAGHLEGSARARRRARGRSRTTKSNGHEIVNRSRRL